MALNANESAVQSVGKLSERIKECDIYHHVVCCNCSHFCSSFSATTSAQLPRSTSQVAVTRGAMALNPKRVCSSTTFCGRFEDVSSQARARSSERSRTDSNRSTETTPSGWPAEITSTTTIGERKGYYLPLR